VEHYPFFFKVLQNITIVLFFYFPDQSLESQEEGNNAGIWPHWNGTIAKDFPRISKISLSAGGQAGQCMAQAGALRRHRV
jgi:hypothetical protein